MLTPRDSLRYTLEWRKSPANCAISAATSSSGPARPGRTSARAKTSAGATANQALAGQRSSLTARIRPLRTAGTTWVASTTVIAIGTNASGIEKSMGTNASWLATVKPNGVSKLTRTATHMTANDRTAASGFHPCGDGSANSAATAATKATLMPSSTSSSRRAFLASALRRVAASASCSSIVSSRVMVRTCRESVCAHLSAAAPPILRQCARIGTNRPPDIRPPNH